MLDLRQLLAVERPHIAFHVAGEVDLHRSVGRPHVGVTVDRHEVAIDEHLMPNILQPLAGFVGAVDGHGRDRSEEHTSELQSLMRSSYAVFCLKKKKKEPVTKNNTNNR